MPNFPPGSLAMPSERPLLAGAATAHAILKLVLRRATDEPMGVSGRRFAVALPYGQYVYVRSLYTGSCLLEMASGRPNDCYTFQVGQDGVRLVAGAVSRGHAALNKTIDMFRQGRMCPRPSCMYGAITRGSGRFTELFYAQMQPGTMTSARYVALGHDGELHFSFSDYYAFIEPFWRLSKAGAIVDIDYIFRQPELSAWFHGGANARPYITTNEGHPMFGPRYDYWHPVDPIPDGPAGKRFIDSLGTTPFSTDFWNGVGDM